MNKHSVYRYFWLGTCVRYLQDVVSGTSVHGDSYVLWNYDRLKEELNELGLKVSRNALHSFSAVFEPLRGTPDNYLLTDADEKQLRKSMDVLRVVIDSEMHNTFAYSLSRKRLSLENLIGDIAALFAPNTFEELPEIAQYDIREAGKCIAFERPTAGAFHVLRATEEVVRMFYRRMVLRSRISSKNWGPIVADLRKRNKTKGHRLLLDHLDHIRHSFRNPTAHPEVIYSIDEVQDLWGICVEVVNRMIGILRNEGR